MNKAYKVIYNKATGVFAAVAEFAKAQGKSSSATVNSTISSKSTARAFALTALASGVLLSSSAWAVQLNGGTAADEKSLAIMPGAVVEKTEGIAIGTNAKALSNSGNTAAQSVVVGYEAKSVTGGVAIGYQANTVPTAGKGTNEQSIAIGYQTTAKGDQATALGSQANANGNSSIAIGGDDLDKVASNNPPVWNATGLTEAQSTALNNTAAAKKYYELTGDNLVHFNDPAQRYKGTAAGEGAVAVGVKSQAGDLATAFGTRTVASGVTSVSLGVGSTATGEGAFAAAAGAQSHGKSAIALGTAAKANTSHSVSIGNGAGKENADFGTAAGDVANGKRAAVANLYSGGVKTPSPELVATHTNISIGKDAGSYGAGINNIAMGTGAGIYQQGENSVAIGTNANNYQVNGMSDHATNRTVGNGTKNSNTINRSRFSVAIGNNAMTYDDHSVAVGDGAKSLRNGSVAIGKDAKAITHYQTAGEAKQTMSAIAIGEGATAALGGDITIGIGSGSRVNQNTTPTTNMFAPQNITVGNSSGDNVYGWTNTVFGSNSGKNIGTSEKPNYANTAFGYGVGNNIRGDNNVNVGYLSGSNIVSNSNTSVGTRVGSHVSGANNVTTGYGSGNRVRGGGNWSAGLEAGNNIGVLEGNATLDVNTNTFKVGQDNAKVLGSDNNVAAGKKAGNFIAGSNNVAFGENAGSYVGNNTTLSQSNHNTAIGSNSGRYIKGNHNTAIGYGAGAGADGDILDRTRSLSQGYQATAYTNDSIAVGSDAKAGTKGSTTAVNAIAIGKGAQATAKDTISIGTGNVVSGQGSGAIGDPSVVQGTNSYSLGNNNAIGSASDNVLTLGGQNNVGATATRNGSGVITDTSALTQAQNADRAFVLGYKNTVAATADASDSVVIGNENTVDAQNTMVLGNKVTATAANNVILGNESSEDSATTTAGQATDVENGTVNGITYGSFAGMPVGIVSVGATGKERQIINVAAGKISADSTDAINGSQLYAVADTLGGQVSNTYFHVNTGANDQDEGDATTNLGKITDKAGATGTYSVTAGVNAQASGYKNVAIGYNSGNGAAAGEYNTYIGQEAGKDSNLVSSIALGQDTAQNRQGGQIIAIGEQAAGDQRSDEAKADAALNLSHAVAIGQRAMMNATGHHSQAIGTYAGANKAGNNNISMGYYAGSSGEDLQAEAIEGSENVSLGTFAGVGIKGNDNIALGQFANANHMLETGTTLEVNNTISIGRSSVANKENTVAIGSEAQATHVNSVALGAGSVTEVATAVTNGVVNDITYGNFAGVGSAEKGSISVGAAGKERQIKNVAAGEISAQSTDAINGSQLYLTQDRLGNVANAVVQNFGGNAKLNTDPTKQGDITFTNIGDTGKDTIHDAIIAAKSNVVAGTNIANVTPTTNTDGSKTYTVNANGTTVSNGSNAVSVTPGTKDAQNVTDYAVDLSQASKDSLARADTALQEFTTSVNGSTTETINKNNKDINFVNGTGTKARASGTDITFDVNKSNLTVNNNGTVTADVAGDNFATAEQVAKAINDSEKTTTVIEGSNAHVQSKVVGNNTEYTVSADKATVSVSSALKKTETSTTDGTTQAVTTDYALDLSDETKAQIAKEESVVAGDNVTVTEDGINGTGGKQYKVALNNNLDLGDTGSVTTGNTTINNDGLKVGDVNVTNAPISVNGTTVNNINDAINQTAAQAFKPLTFAGDSGDNVTRKLGETVTVKGGVTDVTKLSDGNIGVVANGSDTLDIKLAKDIAVDSVKTGDTTINNDGVTINNGPSFTKDKVDVAGNKITNVANGEGDNDAVNVSQLKDAQAAATTKVEGDQGVTVTSEDNADGSKTYTVAAKTDGVTTEVDPNGNIAAITGDITTDDKGNASTTMPNALATAQTVTDAINNSGFTAKANGDAGEFISSGDEVNFINGKNIAITREGANFTVATKDDVNFNSVTLGNDTSNVKLVHDKGALVVTAAPSIGKGPIVINAQTGSISGLEHNLPRTDTDGFNADGLNYATAVKKPNTAGNANHNAATVQDILNSGWNLQGNGEAKDFVKPYETVNFADGQGTVAKVEVNEDGTVSNVSYDIKTDGVTTEVDVNGNIAAITGDITTDDKGNASTTMPNALATTQTVSDAINASGFNVKSGGNKAEGDEAEATLINPGEEVEFNAGKNLTVKRVGNVFTYATSDDVEFNSVKIPTDVAGESVVINKDGINAGNTKITNVADGVYDDDAVNVSQLKQAQNAAKTEVKAKAGTPVTVDLEKGDNGQSIYTVGVNTTTLAQDADGKAKAGDTTSLVTGDQVATAINNAGLKFSGDVAEGDTNTFTRTNQQETKIVGGVTNKDQLTDGNIGVVSNGADTLTIKLAKTLTDLEEAEFVDTDGNETVVNAKGVTITPSAEGKQPVSLTDNGLDNGGNKITNVAAGVADTDAVNVSQLKQAQKAATTKVEGEQGVSVTPTTNADGSTTYTVSAKTDGVTTYVNGEGEVAVNTTNLTNTNGKVNSPSQPNALVDAQTVTDAINNSGFNVQTNGGDKELVKAGETVNFVNGDNIEITNNGKTITVSTAKDVKFDSVNIGDTVNIDNTGINAGNTKITNVARGDDLNDAVNVEQLNEAVDVINTNVKAAKTEVTGTGLATVTETTGDNGQTIYNVDVAKAAAPTVTRGNVTVADADKDKVMTAEQVANAINDSEKTSSVVAGSTAVTVKAGNEDDKGNTEYTVDLSDETKAQIAKEESVVAGDNIIVTEDGTNETGGKQYTVALNNNLDLGETGSVTTGDTVINNDGLTINNGPTITKDTVDVAGNKITNVADGTDPTDAVNVSQLKKSVAGVKTEIKAGQNVQVDEATGANGQTVYTVNATDTSASVTAGSNALTVTKGATTKVGAADVTDYSVDLAQATKDDIKKGVDAKDIVDNKGLTFTGDDGTTDVQKLGSTVAVKGDNNISTKASANTIEVMLNKDITVDSVTANNMTVGPVNITNNGIDAGDTTITNVKAGVNDTDAVNVSQLKGMAQNIYDDINYVNNRIGQVDREAKAGIASAMAFEEAPFVPGKWTYAVGAAHYGGEQAVAATLRKTADNGRWAFSGGISTASEGDTGFRIGVSGVID